MRSMGGGKDVLSLTMTRIIFTFNVILVVLQLKNDSILGAPLNATTTMTTMIDNGKSYECYDPSIMI